MKDGKRIHIDIVDCVEMNNPFQLSTALHAALFIVSVKFTVRAKQ